MVDILSFNSSSSQHLLQIKHKPRLSLRRIALPLGKINIPLSSNESRLPRCTGLALDEINKELRMSWSIDRSALDVSVGLALVDVEEPIIKNYL